MKLIRVGAWIMGVMAAVTLSFVLVGILLPSTWEASAERTLAAPPEVVFPLLEQAQAWSAWMPTPESGLDFFGPERGAEGGFAWDDPGYGQGVFTLTSVEPSTRIGYRVEVEGGSIRIEGNLQLSADGDQTRVVWHEAGDFGWNPLLGYIAGRMSTLQGEQLAYALESLEEQVLAQAVGVR